MTNAHNITLTRITSFYAVSLPFFGLGLIRVISSTQLDDSVITRLLKFIVYALDQVLFALLTSQIIVSLKYALSL